MAIQHSATALAILIIFCAAGCVRSATRDHADNGQNRTSVNQDYFRLSAGEIEGRRPADDFELFEQSGLSPFFYATDGFSRRVVGVEDYYNNVANDVDIIVIEGTSDSVSDIVDRSRIDNYAEAFNSLMKWSLQRYRLSLELKLAEQGIDLRLDQ